MYKELENQEFDFVIVGTSLSESILSSHLSKCGKKVIHFDISKFYGGDCKNFSFKDLNQYLTEAKSGISKDPHLSNLKLVAEEYSQSNHEFLENEKIREYNFDLNPKFLYGQSKSTTSLSSTRASQYMEFVSTKKILLHHESKFLTIPCTKSEIFVNEDLKLFEKQKLLNFIYAVMKLKNTLTDVNTTNEIKKEYEVENKIYDEIKNNLNSNSDEFLKCNFSHLLQSIIKFILANLDPNEIHSKALTLDKLTDNIYKFLNSLLVYDKTPFIYPLYGSSEFSQALCRMSSVYGSIFIVNDTLVINIGKNAEYSNETNKKYVVSVYDQNNDSSFSILTDNIIINQNFLCSKSNFNFNDNILNYSSLKTEGYHQFISFHIIENNTKIRRQACPVIYKIPKYDSFLKNEFGFTVFEFDLNSCSAPKNRTLLQLVVNAEIENLEENEFSSIGKKIADNFINSHLEYIKNDIKTEVDEENQNSSQTGMDSSNEVKLLCTFQFYRETLQSDECLFGDVIVTHNNYTENDIDFYYNECEKILKEKEWDILSEKDTNQKELNQDSDEQNYTSNLIDELFDCIDKDK